MAELWAADQERQALRTRDHIAENTGVTGRTADKMMKVFEAAESGDELAQRMADELLSGPSTSGLTEEKGQALAGEAT